MNAASGQNLSCVFFATGDGACTARETGGTLGDVADTPRFCRTTMTRIQGVSDPLRIRRGTAIGGWQRGSLTPQMPPPLLLTTALTARRAAQSAARCTGTKSHTAKNIAKSTRLTTMLPRPRSCQRTAHQEGEHCSRVCVPPSWRTFIRKLRILGGAEFIEAPTFTAIVAGYLEDDEYRALQLFLAGDPEAGDVMPGTGGFRKLRWADRRRGKGKRGGLRVIYYHLSADAQIWLMTLYDKDEMADLSAAEKRALKAALDAELARRAARRRLRRK
jgi:hypothetical protein